MDAMNPCDGKHDAADQEPVASAFGSDRVAAGGAAVAATGEDQEPVASAFGSDRVAAGAAAVAATGEDQEPVASAFGSDRVAAGAAAVAATGEDQEPVASAFGSDRVAAGAAAVAATGQGLEFRVYLLTWTTYGTWLPGDARGWRKRGCGPQSPQPLLETWCQNRMKGDVVLLRPHDRDTVEDACREHCDVRGWHLLAVNARTNHVHVVVGAAASPKTVRDQLKANCTRRLRTQPAPLVIERTWTAGGDCELLEGDEAIDSAVAYVVHAQNNQQVESDIPGNASSGS